MTRAAQPHPPARIRSENTNPNPITLGRRPGERSRLTFDAYRVGTIPGRAMNHAVQTARAASEFNNGTDGEASDPPPRLRTQRGRAVTSSKLISLR